VAAGALIVEEAGGQARISPGEPAGKIHLVASNGRLPLEFV